MATKKKQNQAATLRAAREALNVNTEGLAGLLGVSPSTVRSWIAPPTSKMHRPMPRTAELLLTWILEDHRKRAKGK